MDIKRDSGKDLCCAVFCMTVPLVQHAHTRARAHIHHTHTEHMAAWMRVSSTLSVFWWRCNKTLHRLLNELLRPAGANCETFKKTQASDTHTLSKTTGQT